MATSLQIANEFIRRAVNSNKSLTQMQLQKLVYIAHGWNLAINNIALTEDSPKAWDYGPVYPDLWRALRHYGGNVVNRPILVSETPFGIFADTPEAELTAELRPEETALIDSIFSNYSQYHAFKLSAMTHETDTPWHKTYIQDNNIKGVIDNMRIQKHFVEIARSGQSD